MLGNRVNGEFSTVRWQLVITTIVGDADGATEGDVDISTMSVFDLDDLMGAGRILSSRRRDKLRG